MHKSTKRFGPFSACFRQPLADSHCKFLHGYGLEFLITFAATELDERGWVMDFGGLKSFKEILERNFDHKTLVATDDPNRHDFMFLHDVGLAQVNFIARVGCEAFAQQVHHDMAVWLAIHELAPRVQVISVQCFEHANNSAIYEVPYEQRS